MKELVYNGVTIRDKAETLHMTDMWKAAGSPSTARPIDWLRTERAQALIAFIADDLSEKSNVGQDHFGLVSTKTGGNDPTARGTWAHWKIGMAYAADLSPAFKSWMLDVARDYMLGKLGQARPGTTLADTIVSAHAANPTLFSSHAMLRDNLAFLGEMRRLIARLAKTSEKSWQWAHGQLRSNFKVVSYGFLTLDAYDLVIRWLWLRIRTFTPQLPPAPGSQTTLFDL